MSKVGAECYEMWQYCDGVIAVRLHQRLHWQPSGGPVKVETAEPVHLWAGIVPEDEAGRQRIVTGIQDQAVQGYLCIEGVKRAWWA